MKLIRLTLDRFTVFHGRPVTFEFAPGVNVFIGENGTGKSHVLKLLYALTEAVRRFATGDGLDGGRHPKLEGLVQGLLMSVFQPDDLGSFTPDGDGHATICLEWTGAKLDVTISPPDGLTASFTGAFSDVGRPLFIPPREVLSIFPGFDRTYFDLCVALGLKPLRDQSQVQALLASIERELNGTVSVEDGRFYLNYLGGAMEMPMIAEGDRKLAMIAYLLMNGSLSANAHLLWDEPEANLNPKRAHLTADIIAGLAHADVQVFLGTHDYALTSDFSLKVDTGELRTGESAFFALYRDDKEVGVFVERGVRLAELQHNAILDALASLHAREQGALFTTDAPAEDPT